MDETSPVATLNEAIRIVGNTLTLKVGDYVLSLKIEGPAARPGGRFKLQGGKTMFDLVLEAARAFVNETGRNEFSPADLYRIASEKHPGLNIRKNSWYAHVTGSAPNHPSYRHHTSHRDYFWYHGGGKYSLEPDSFPQREAEGGNYEQPEKGH